MKWGSFVGIPSGGSTFQGGCQLMYIVEIIVSLDVFLYVYAALLANVDLP